MIGVSGNNLSVLIVAKYNFTSDWLSYASYRSVKKYLPDSDVSIVCARDFKKIPYFNWVKGFQDIKFFQYANLGKSIKCELFNKLYGVFVAVKEEIVAPFKPLLIIDCDLLAVQHLPENIISAFDELDFAYSSDFSLWYIKNPMSILNVINDYKNYNSDCEHAIRLSLFNSLKPHKVVKGICCASKDTVNSFFVHTPAVCMGSDYPPFDEKCFEDVISSNEASIIKLWRSISRIYLVAVSK